jgi:cysteinyl-tRNA synthetase
MELKLYDTLTREKRVFRPLDPANVRMYVCGPTVYDFAHIGNARPVIVFDVLFRLLRHLYGADHVTYVRNITDVDDKINARAAEEYPALPLNEAIRKVTEKTDRQFHEDVAALGCLPPTVEPRATENIAEMRTLIERLVASGNAYVAEDNVLFSVPSMPDYGALSKRPLDEMIAGARVEVAPYKKDPQDFILWKPSKPGEPAWPSPCGIAAPGRPGWHIECSAMSSRYLGEIFDIHGGGIDLVFPHHENEIAQSRCAFHTPVMANYWVHNGFLQVEGEKMAKSLGNFVTIRELLKDWPGTVVRLNMLQTHYRQPIDWRKGNLINSFSELKRWAIELRDGVEARRNKPPSNAIVEALGDDLNTHAALTVLRQRSALRTGDLESRREEMQGDLKFLGILDKRSIMLLSSPIKSTIPLTDVLFERVDRLRAVLLNKVSAATSVEDEGVRIQYSGSFFEILPILGARESFESKTERLIEARNAAHKAKNFTESDRIRDELAKMGVVLKDTKDGTTWEIAR